MRIGRPRGNLGFTCSRMYQARRANRELKVLLTQVCKLRQPLPCSAEPSGPDLPQQAGVGHGPVPSASQACPLSGRISPTPAQLLAEHLVPQAEAHTPVAILGPGEYMTLTCQPPTESKGWLRIKEDPMRLPQAYALLLGNGLQ